MTLFMNLRITYILKFKFKIASVLVGIFTLLIKYLALWLVIPLLLLLVLLIPFGFTGVTLYIVISSSMKPTLDVGDVVFLIQDHDGVNIGDIIGYVSNGEIIIRRVIRIIRSGNETAFITKGDANRNPDPQPVYPNQVIGKYLVHIPKIGWPIIVIKDLLRNIHLID